MKCPACSRPDMAVKDSRPTVDDATVKRRRLCESCGHRSTTIEVILSDNERGYSGHDRALRHAEMADLLAGLPPDDLQLARAIIGRLSANDGSRELKTVQRSALRAEAYS